MLTLSVLPGEYSICRLPIDEIVDDITGPFFFNHAHEK
jgi:hypothetical protein